MAAERKEENINESITEEKKRRQTKSESLIHSVLRRTLSGSRDDDEQQDTDMAKQSLRHRSYSTNDSDEYQRKLEQTDGPRRMSFTEILLGRRSFMNSTINEPLTEESSRQGSVENIHAEKTGDDDVIASNNSKDTEDSLSEGLQVMSTNEETYTSKPYSTDGVTREVTQTDHLNKRLLDAFLAKINSFAGSSEKGGSQENQKENGESAENKSQDYNILYTDDFILDHICRRLDKKK